MWFALVFVITLAAVSGNGNAQQRQRTLQQPHNQPSQQQTAPDTRGTESNPVIIKEFPRERAQQEKGEAQEKANLDRKLAGYTGDLAFYTKCLFGATLLLSGLTGVLAYAAYRQSPPLLKRPMLPSGR